MGADIGPEMPWLLKYGHRAKNARLGTDEPFSVELAECYDENGPIGKQAKKLAPRYQILSCQVENLDDTIAELRSKGYHVSDKLEMDYPDFEVDGKKDKIYECMVHPKSSYSLGIELLQFDKAPPHYGLKL